MKFKLVAPFKPTGDQPQAIEALAKNIKSGVKHQTLLGVTGSGKSVVKRTPVLLKKGGQIISADIGKIINQIFETFPEKIKLINGSNVVFAKDLPLSYRYETYSFHPGTKRVSWKPIDQYTRHPAPKQLYKVTTSCEREITVTGDHNFFVLKDGNFTLVETDEIKNGYHIPIPLLLDAPKKQLSVIYLPDYFPDKNKLYVSLPTFAAVWRKKQKTLRRILSPAKIHNILHVGERVPYEMYQNLIRAVPPLKRGSRVGINDLTYQANFDLQLTDGFLRFLGYYIAEGHAEQRYFILSSGDKEIINDFIKSLNQIGLRSRHRPNTYDYQIGSLFWVQILITLCGHNSKTKHLPSFWPQLSNNQLAQLLKAYFSADGGVDNLALSCTTASFRLAYEIMEALLRFGIIARIRKRAIKLPGRNERGEYWCVNISGQKFLEIYKEKIGFTLQQKNTRLEAITGKKYNTNTDIIPLDGAWLKSTRSALSLTQEEIAFHCKINRSHISMIESGIRKPSRESFKKIISKLKKITQRQKNYALLTEIMEKETLLNLYWTPVKKVEQVSKEKYVYDFAVKDNETFLAGFGGFFVHNTFTMANVIEKVQKSTLVISHNKTLAAQLYQEFKEFFPENAVHYFVSYYDYYQPEAYIPQTDTYIEKDAKINEELDRLRHAATQSLLARPDTIIVASVSCIYNIGSPEEYQNLSVEIKKGQNISRQTFLRQLAALQYLRSDINFKRGSYRVRGESIEIWLATGEEIIRITFDGNKISQISGRKIAAIKDLFTAKEIPQKSVRIYPAKFWVSPQEKINLALANIKAEMEEQTAKLKKQGKLLEAERLRRRTNFDLEMLKETGYCHGIENYSRHLEFREPGDAPFTLLDYFSNSHSHKFATNLHNSPNGFLTIIDESHMSIPQIGGMYFGDRSRKETLIEFGFRLPSALDNRPLKFQEFEKKVNRVVYVSATPRVYEIEKSKQYCPEKNPPQPSPVSSTGQALKGGNDSPPLGGVRGDFYIIEQLVRPTGLLDPKIKVRPTKNQIPDLISEIKKRVAQKQRVLVTTLTKRMAEDLADYLTEEKIKTQYLHSEIKTLERPEILKDLRLGKYDVVVGVNLLREGLDLPEVSLVAILDADKEGFLRNETTLIQTIGRVSRHPSGLAIMYADKITHSMKRAIEETIRRRKIQKEYNKRHNISPQPIKKEVRPSIVEIKKAAEIPKTQKEYLKEYLKELQFKMDLANRNLQFDETMRIKNEIEGLKKFAKNQII